MTDDDGLPLKGATVKLAILKDSTTTDANGRWILGRTTSVAERSTEVPVATGRSRLEVSSGRLLIRLDGRNALGEKVRFAPAAPAGAGAARESGLISVPDDTLRLVAAGFGPVSKPVKFSSPLVLDTSAISLGGPGMARIQEVTYMMGSTGVGGAAPHKVRLSVFYIDSTEVTRASFASLMGRDPSVSSGADCKNCPVESVTWYDAIRYCNARSRAEGRRPAYDTSNPDSTRWTWISGSAGYRLPTEAEWEYAARGGTSSDWYWGAMIGVGTVSQYAWYSLDAEGTTHPVAGLKPNAFGLADVAGNVWEWVWDWYQYQYPTADAVNPRGPEDDMNMIHKVLRGGSFTSINTEVAQTRRIHALPYAVFGDIGFRCVIGIPSN